MNENQIAATNALRLALRKVQRANLALRVFDGDVWLVPDDVELWPNGSEGNVMDVLSEHGKNVTPPNLNADGGAGV